MLRSTTRTSTCAVLQRFQCKFMKTDCKTILRGKKGHTPSHLTTSRWKWVNFHPFGNEQNRFNRSENSWLPTILSDCMNWTLWKETQRNFSFQDESRLFFLRQKAILEARDKPQLLDQGSICGIHHEHKTFHFRRQTQPVWYWLAVACNKYSSPGCLTFRSAAGSKYTVINSNHTHHSNLQDVP